MHVVIAATVFDLRCRKAADQCEVVQLLRRMWDEFTDVRSRNRRGDRVERAPGRRASLGIPALELTDAAGKVDHQDAFCILL